MRKSIAAALIAAAAATSACGQDRSENGGPTVARTTRSAVSTRSRSAGRSTSKSAPAPILRSARAGRKRCSIRWWSRFRAASSSSARSAKRAYSIPAGISGTRSKSTVTVPMLRAAAIGGSGDIKVNEVKGQAFDGSVAGSGSLDVGTARRPVAQARGRRIGRCASPRRPGAERFVRNRGLWRHRRQGRPGADRRRFDRRVGQCCRKCHQHRFGEHHGFGRRRR